MIRRDDSAPTGPDAATAASPRWAAGHAGAVRVLLVDGSQVVRERLRSLIAETVPGLLIAEAANVEAALGLLHAPGPDAVVLDLNLPDGGSFRLLRETRRQVPGCVAVVLASYTEPAFRTACREYGVEHFFSKSREFERVPEVLAELRRARNPTGNSPPTL